MNQFDSLQMLFKGGLNCLGQHGDAIDCAFAVADSDLIEGEIDVFHSEPKRFPQAQAGAVEEIGEQEVCTGEVGQDEVDFGFGEDCWQVLRAFGAFDLIDGRKTAFEHVSVEKEESAQSYGLSGGGDVALDCEVGEELADFVLSHFVGMAFVVEEDKAFDPVDVGLFSVAAKVFETRSDADLVQQFR